MNFVKVETFLTKVDNGHLIRSTFFKNINNIGDTLFYFVSDRRSTFMTLRRKHKCYTLVTHDTSLAYDGDLPSGDFVPLGILALEPGPCTSQG